MALDHYVSQVHLKNFYASEMGERMYAFPKKGGEPFPCNSVSQCRVLEGSTNRYLENPRAIEEFLKDVEPCYNEALTRLRAGDPDAKAIRAIAGFVAYVDICSPAANRIAPAPLKTIVEIVAASLDASDELATSPSVLGVESIGELLKSGKIKAEIDPRYPQSIGIETILDRVAILGNSPWHILVNEIEDSPFFTSDYPIVIERSELNGVLNKVIPLAPNLAVRVFPNPALRSLAHDLRFGLFQHKLVRLNKQEVVEINKSIVQCAETTVYSSHNRKWVKPFVARFADFRVEPISVEIPVATGSIVSTTRAIRPYKF